MVGGGRAVRIRVPWAEGWSPCHLKRRQQTPIRTDKLEFATDLLESR